MNRLSLLREEHGWNMREAAQHFELAYTTYVGYEKGERMPSFDLVCKMAEFYNVDVTYLMGTSDMRGRFPSHGDSDETEKPTDIDVDGLNRELADCLRRLKPADLPKVMAFVQGLLASREA